MKVLEWEKKVGSDNYSILQKDCDIVLVTPEFIMHNTDGDQLKKLNVSIIIVDECHLMISWGKLIIF